MCSDKESMTEFSIFSQHYLGYRSCNERKYLCIYLKHENDIILFLTENEENVSPGKKRVHFAGDGKENSRLITKPQEHCLVKRHQWANMRVQALGEEEKIYSPKPREMQGIR